MSWFKKTKKKSFDKSFEDIRNTGRLSFIQKKTADSTRRHLITNNTVFDVTDGIEEIRSVFLFNDILACGQLVLSSQNSKSDFVSRRTGINDGPGYRASRHAIDQEEEKVIFDLKWYIPIEDAVVFCDTKKQKSNSERGEKNKHFLKFSRENLEIPEQNSVLRIKNKTTGEVKSIFLGSDFERQQWIENFESTKKKIFYFGKKRMISSEVLAEDMQRWIRDCQHVISRVLPPAVMHRQPLTPGLFDPPKTPTSGELLPPALSRPNSNLIKSKSHNTLLSKEEDVPLDGDLYLVVRDLEGPPRNAELMIRVVVDSKNKFSPKAQTRDVSGFVSPSWNESFIITLDQSKVLKIILCNVNDRSKPTTIAQSEIKLNKSFLNEQWTSLKNILDGSTLNIDIKFIPNLTIVTQIPATKPGPLFGVDILTILRREKRGIPFLMTACIREVELRGMLIEGIYRKSATPKEIPKLQKLFEKSYSGAEQYLKAVDIHSVAGLLKLYIRELPEALCTNTLYDSFLQASKKPKESRAGALEGVYCQVPDTHRNCIDYLLNHLIKVHNQVYSNKMTLQNLATVFGSYLIRPGIRTKVKKQNAETMAEMGDAMAQTEILYALLKNRNNKI